jgi:quinol monooxygenase YgiN
MPITTMSPVSLSFLVRVEAKPGKEAQVEALLRSALELANQEPRTVHWFAFRIGTSTFGVFDTFADEEGRKAHLAGPIAAALMGKEAAELFKSAPVLERLDILSAKV